MRLFLCLSFLLLPHLVYPQSTKSQSQYPDHVGDISFDPKLDDPAFRICANRSNYQYYNFGKGVQYKGEKPAIEDHFKELRSNKLAGETGYVTIRFIVNCEGKTGRFRVQEMDANYQARTFDKTLVTRLLNLTKQLNGWIPAVDTGYKVDYYQYLSFKIENGKLMEILP